MVTPTDSMLAIGRAIETSGLMPDDISYLFHEEDLQSEDSNVSLPMIQIEPVVAEHVNPNNTDHIGFTTDDNENRTGEIYAAEYELTAEIDIWTEFDGQYDVDELGNRLRKALYPYNSYGPQRGLPDENGVEIDTIFRFDVNDGERQDDVVHTPTVRRWRHEVEVWAYEEFETTEEYIVDVVPPSPDGVTDDNQDGTLDS